MYVIFPADELIFMTYGAAVPRLQPRPTLDNLREPLVPAGTRPSPTRSLVSGSLYLQTPSTAINISPIVSTSFPTFTTNNIHDNYQPQSRFQSRESSPFNISNKNTREDNLTTISEKYPIANNISSFHTNDKLTLSSGYDRMTDYTQQNRYMRDRSPSIYLEPSSPPLSPTANINISAASASGINVSSGDVSIISRTSSRPVSPTTSSRLYTGATGVAKPKSKPKLTLALGRLGRQQPDQSESVRLREDLEIHVANPTFTRDNLVQRNFDAFFESGEPVYSLEPKLSTANTLSPDTDSYSPLSSHQQLTATSGYESSTSAAPKGRSLGLFGRPKSPLVWERAKSADLERFQGTDVSQKEPPSAPKGPRSLFKWKGTRGGSLSPQASMASYSGALKECGHASLNEALKTHNGVTFKLVKTVSDFTESLSHLYEEHANALQDLVSTYRKKNGELRKERPACHSTLFQAWETFLQEIEADSQASSDVASSLSRQVSRPMLDKSFHRKVQSRKIFTHRESFETIIAKTEEKLSKCRIEYKQCFVAHRQNPTQLSLTQYIDAHNAYVQQLHATNAMLEAYNCETIPQLMQELEEIYSDLCNIVAEAVLQGAEIISLKASEQAKRYDGLSNQCRTISPQQDLIIFTRILPQPPNQQKIPKKVFAPPQPPGEGEDPNEYNDSAPPPLRNELVIDRHSSLQLRPALEALKREAADLEILIRQLQDSVDTLVRTQARGIENQLYNKANELQEDLSMKKFDLRAKQIHLAAIRAQKELFLCKLEPAPGSPRGERKLSIASSSSMKTKWLKAFRSLKPASGSSAQPERRNGAAGTQPLRPNEDGSHNLQEYTYKKITPCDVCSQILRGHTRQGLRCRICKLNAHADCAPQLPKCQAKQKLLRRQKSTSELENRVDIEEEKITDIDQIYRVLKQAGEISGNKTATAAAAAAANKISSSQQQQQPTINVTNTGQSQQQQQQQKLEGDSQSKSQSNVQLQPQDIPIVNVPECPERSTGTISSRSGGRGPSYKPPPGSSGGSSSTRVALQAPQIQDVSSSDYRIPSAQISVNAHRQIPPPPGIADTGLRRRLFAGFRPLSGFGRGRNRSAQHRSISLPETPHSPRRHKLNLRMKSLSLDSPESSELHGQMRRRQPPAAGPSSSYYHGGSGGQLEHSTPPSNNSRLHSPSSPSHQRKLLYANRGLRTGSVDLPDDVEKSLSSASTSPCPSPVRQHQKSHRLLPTNLYVILYNFKARHADELDLKAGYKVTVIDTSDPDWWKGKFLGRMGYFPSKYCARLNAGEKPLQVTHNLQVSDGERGENMTLLRDQIVIQVGEEVNGMVMVRSAENRQGYCPVKYLQEV